MLWEAGGSGAVCPPWIQLAGPQIRQFEGTVTTRRQENGVTMPGEQSRPPWALPTPT